MRFIEQAAGMKDQDKSKQQLIEENEELRRQVALLQGIDAEREQAEEELAKSNAILTAAVECLPFDFFALDPEGRCILQNALSRQYYGEALGKTAEQICPDERVLPHWIEGNRRAFAGERVEGEMELTLGGSRRHFSCFMAPIQCDGRLYGALGVNVDITERKRVEQELAKSEAMLQAAIDCLPFNFFAIGLDGRYVLQNAVSKAQQRADVIGKRPEEVCPNEHDLAIWLDNNRRAFAGEKVEGEVTLSLGGEERVYYNVIAPVTDGTDVYGILGVNIDITERKRAEGALQKAHDELERRVEERTAELRKANKELAIFRAFAEASREGFGMSEFDGRIVYVNQTLCRLFGEENPEDVIGKNVSTYSPEEYKQRRKNEVLPALLRDGYWHAEHTILPLRGKPIEVSQSTFLIRDESGDPFRLAAVISDITERKQAQEALRQSHNELQSIYDGMVDGMHIVNLVTMRAVRANSALCRMMGYSEEELLSLSQSEVHPPEELPRIVQSFQAHVEGRVSQQADVPMVRKDGSIFYADITTSRIFYKEAPCLICFFRDTTERRKAQDALERERQSLWRMLQASDHERQIISYEIHDGLAQYLAAAGMQFDVHDALRQNSPDEARKAYDAATQLVRQSHIEARRLISEVRPPVIDEIGLETAISHLVHEQRRHGGPKIKFDSDVQFSRLPSILENALYRIVQEALTNACKHSKSKKVAVAMTQEGQDVRLEVQDWGIGFDPQMVGKDHFGLEGIRQRVRLLGGRLTIESTPDSGTVVQVVVPILEKQNEE